MQENKMKLLRSTVTFILMTESAFQTNITISLFFSFFLSPNPLTLSTLLSIAHFPFCRKSVDQKQKLKTC